MPQLQIKGFSPRVFREIRRFYEQHPVYSMVQLREIEVESRLVKVTEIHCLKCGDYLPLIDKAFPADALRAIRFTHEYRIKDRAEHCGGRLEMKTAPVQGLISAEDLLSIGG